MSVYRHELAGGGFQPPAIPTLATLSTQFYWYLTWQCAAMQNLESEVKHLHFNQAKPVAFYPSFYTALAAVQLPRQLDALNQWCLWKLLWQCEIDNQATTPYPGYWPSTTFLPVWPHCINVRWNWKRCQDLNSLPLGELEETTVLRGRRLSSKTWNSINSPRIKQLTWLRIVLFGDWCLRLALCTPSGAR